MGLGTATFPEDTFWPVQNFVLKSLAGEGIRVFRDLYRPEFSRPKSADTKAGDGMLTKYIGNEEYDLHNSFVIGDRITDVQLAKNLGCKAIWLNNDPALGGAEISDSLRDLEGSIALETPDWGRIYEFLKLGCGGWFMSVIPTRRRSESN
jgi:imidazoleglycerol-phosphate dehydratase/histidinol-phosphatase